MMKSSVKTIQKSYNQWRGALGGGGAPCLMWGEQVAKAPLCNLQTVSRAPLEVRLTVQT